ncbi:phage tail sheath family protein [Trichocoleus sp. FACHB-591]|uniref:phage tail sheath family protein n=1 Tax=Trichocoleus sp. FACHB-591 TaxID=2692872 RepID=UPI0016886862|nr:phage tail sheath subtilisin-like domain-containing protein [Trichocoleus sp. FACHB-591]MBD2094095.1 phage tail sheath family protein [Trichocoleus sp. FACHB-591]
MVNLSSIPGIYREEVFAKLERQLLTGIPAFLGLASQGSVNQPQELTLWTQFLQIFGPSLPNSYLYYAVRGFFSNGGTSCYIVRLDENLAPETALLQGLESLAALDTVDLICVPDLSYLSRTSDQSQQMQAAILDHCQQLGDRFAILDAWKDATVATVQQQQQQLSEHPGALNGALYFPWVQVENSPPELRIPPCGHIAGVYARSDRNTGVHQAPANFLLEDVLDLSVSLSHGEQMTLSSASQAGSINYLRVLPGRGIRVWGSRTLSQSFDWQHINVRRLFLTVARWGDRHLADVAFEPNNFQLWVRIERELTAFCESLFQQGALQGATPSAAFYVTCNEETNPPEIRALGQVVTEVGLAPTVPNEFIVVRLIHGSNGVTLSG